MGSEDSIGTLVGGGRGAETGISEGNVVGVGSTTLLVGLKDGVAVDTVIGAAEGSANGMGTSVGDDTGAGAGSLLGILVGTDVGFEVGIGATTGDGIGAAIGDVSPTARVKRL